MSGELHLPLIKSKLGHYNTVILIPLVISPLFLRGAGPLLSRRSVRLVIVQIYRDPFKYQFKTHVTLFSALQIMLAVVSDLEK